MPQRDKLTLNPTIIEIITTIYAYPDSNMSRINRELGRRGKLTTYMVVMKYIKLLEGNNIITTNKVGRGRIISLTTKGYKVGEYLLKVKRLINGNDTE